MNPVGQVVSTVLSPHRSLPEGAPFGRDTTGPRDLFESAGTASLRESPRETPPVQEPPPSVEGAPVRPALASLPAETLFLEPPAEEAPPRAMPPALRPGALAGGRPFAPPWDTRLQDVAGFPITRDGLAGLYEGCLPGAHTFISQVRSVQPDSFDYTITLRDHFGEERAQMDRRVHRHPDGSAELHRFNARVSPRNRGGAVTARSTLQEIALLKAVAPHPNSRITLRAGHGYVAGTSATQKLGTYTWANYGFFDFADNHPEGRSRIQDYPDPRAPGDDGTLKDVELMRVQFGRWLDRMAATDPRLADADLRAALREVAEAWREPWHIAHTRVPGLRFPVSLDGGKPLECDLGKAFMLSPESPFWDAACYVCRPDGQGVQVGLEYAESSLEKASRRDRERRTRMEGALGGGDPVRALETLADLARDGDVSWLPRLDAMTGPDPVGRAAERAARAIRGEFLAGGLRRQVERQDLVPAARVRAWNDLAQVEGRRDAALGHKMLADGNEELRYEVLLDLYWGEPPVDGSLLAREGAWVLDACPTGEGGPFRPSVRSYAVAALALGAGHGALPTLDSLSRAETDPVVLETVSSWARWLGTPAAEAVALRAEQRRGGGRP